VLLFISCSVSQENVALFEKSEFKIEDRFFSGKAMLTSATKGFKVLLLNARGEQLDQIIFNYRLYQLDTADVNHDGKTEILIGLIKSTEFDPGEKKRLFILRIDEGQLRPLWLGSKVCQQLVDFKTLTNGIVQTLEKTARGNYAIGTYEWEGFGLTLINYTHDEKTYDEVIKIFGS
jgi:hypothetical protein